MTQDVNSKSRLVEQYEEVFDTMDCSSCLFDNINEKDQQANQLMRLLNKELTEFMDLLSAKDIQVMECRRKQLSCIFERIVGHLLCDPSSRTFTIRTSKRFLRTLIAAKHLANWKTCAHSCDHWMAI